MGYKDLVVFTDGGDAKQLDTKGINLYALLIGTKKGAPIKLKNGSLLMHNGKVVIVKRDDRFLKYTKFGVIAKTGYSDINELISQNFQRVTNSKKIYVYKELFIYPLWLGLLFISLGFFSILNLKRVIPIFLIFIGVQSKASILDWYYLNQAKEAYQNGDYKKSAEIYKKIDNEEAKYNEANSLYKMKKYKKALNIYNQIKDKKLAEKVEYNKGNCYAKMGKIDEAINSYKNALKLNPNDKDAKYNLELLKKQHKQNKNNKNSNNNKQNNKQKQNSNKKQNNSNRNNKNDSQKNQEQKKNSKEKKNSKQTQKQNKEHKIKQNKLNAQKRINKKELQNIKPIKIGVNKNSNQQIFNKIKSQTLLYPLSKGKNDEKNEW
jgi:Ca-activated chloride channel family protein